MRQSAFHVRWFLALSLLAPLGRSFGADKDSPPSRVKSASTANVDSQDTSAHDAAGPDDPTTLAPEWLAPAWHPETGLLSKHIRPEEADAYFSILNHTRKLSLKQLKDAATQFETERRTLVRNDPAYRYYFSKPDAPFPTFVDLYRTPAAYHGRLVTFRGHVRRLVSYPAGKNDLGLEQLHEAWLYTDDAQQNPVVVVCTELPPQMPVGSDILIDFVSATGYFFKRYGYNDRNSEPRFAPLILAQRLEWTPRPTSRNGLLSNSVLFGVTAAGAAIVAWLWWRVARRDRVALQRFRQMSRAGSDENPFAGSTTPSDSETSQDHASA